MIMEISRDIIDAVINFPISARHLCICLECSEALKKPGSTCPICRSKVESMLQIRVSCDSSTLHDSEY
jgi:hypothetical protein